MASVVVSLVHKDTDGYTFEVHIREPGTATSHRMELSESEYQELTGGRIPPEVLVEKSVEFLLAREPKESILSVFSTMDIRRYFPEYEEEMK